MGVITEERMANIAVEERLMCRVMASRCGGRPRRELD
jgi:hypothetical protein